MDKVVEELNSRLGWEIEEARDFEFEHNGDRLGWIEGDEGVWNYTLFIQNGRVKDTEDYQLKRHYEKLRNTYGRLQIISNQNLIIANVTSEKKKKFKILSISMV